MNKQCYRVVFNKARGMLMVVSEAARSQGKSSNPAAGGSEVSQVAANSQTSQSQGRYQGGKLDVLRSGVLLSLGLATIVGMSSNAIADSTKIVADRNAAANQQATIIKSSNGTTQVNIQSPSNAGVSRNVFSQFDVGRDGAVLNNSRTNTNTQIAGWVEGNPYLARGEARVILNEVNSSDPSRLSGFTEIAGGRAELVIANPAGITCSGCGFVNASRTTLTTGQAMMEQGKLTGFDVTGGKIRVDGEGMSMGGSDYSQIIAKAVALNAGVEAKSLDIITGSNVVSYAEDPEQTQITAKDAAAQANSNASNKTGVALDISSLGGMYAGKIRLIGTDKGLGVTNAGSVIATSGNLQLDAQGNLVNTGDMVANKGKVAINTHDQGVDNAGTISSSRDTLDLTSRTLKNSGVISSHDVATLNQADSINNSGDIIAGSFKVSADDLSNTGKLLQTGQGRLAIDADTLTNTKNATIGQDLYPDAATDPSKTPEIKPSNPPSSANNGSKVEASTNNQDIPEQPAPLPAITQDGSITVKRLSNTGDKAAIYANDSISIKSSDVTNTDKASLAVKGLAINQDGLVDNTDSRIQLDQINWQLADFNNSKGQIIAANGIDLISSARINNRQGTLAATEGNIDLAAKKDIDNTEGLIQSNSKLTTSSQNLTNNKGNITGETLVLSSKGDLTNTEGNISSGKDTKVTSKTISNNKGTINAQGSLSSSADSVDNSGQIYGKSQNSLTASGVINNSGTIASQGGVDIQAGSLTQSDSGSLVAGMNADGKLIDSPAKLNVTTNGAIKSQGQHIATGDVSLEGSDVDLANSSTQGRNINTTASSGDVNTKNATINATGTLKLGSEQGILDNSGGNVSAGVLDINAKALNNTEGKLTQTGNQDLTLNMVDGIDNTRGLIASNSDNLSINTSNLTNNQGVITHAGNTKTSTLAINADTVDNTQGQVLSLKEQTWQIAKDINNAQGLIQGNQFSIAVNSFDNTDGRLLAVSDKDSKNNVVKPTQSQLVVKDAVTNQNTGKTKDVNAGVIASNTGSINISAAALTNSKSQISSVGDLTLTTDNLDNRGSVYSQDQLLINNKNKITNAGNIAAQNDITVNTGTLNQSENGQLIAGLTPEGPLSSRAANLTVNSSGTQTNAGTNIATGDISLTGSNLDLTGSGNQSNTINLTAQSGDVNLTKAQSNITDRATIDASGSLINDGGILQAGRYDLTIGALSNVDGIINQTGDQNLAIVTDGDINNQKGTIAGRAKSLIIESKGNINNQQGNIFHDGEGSATIDAAALNNIEGKIVGSHHLSATVGGKVDNTQGAIQGASTKIESDAINNTDGQILSQLGDIALVSNTIRNSGDKAYIQSAKDLVITSTDLSNSDKATIMAQNAAKMTASKVLNNDSGATIASNAAMAINGGAIVNSAQIASINDSLVISADTINNQSLGQIQSAGEQSITTNQGLMNQGLIATSKALKINTGATLDNQDGIISGTAVTLNSAKDIDNNKGLIAQTDIDQVLELVSKGIISNQNTKANPLVKDAKQLGILANGNAVINSGSLNNQSGIISAKNLGINTQSAEVINNAQGLMQATEQLTLTAAQSEALNNQGGQILADSIDLSVGDKSHGRIDNNGTGSLIQATKNINLTTGIVNNQNTKQAFDATKTQGVLAGDSIVINAATTDNQSGQLLANNKVRVTASQRLNNQSGVIQSSDIAITDTNTNRRQLIVNNDSGQIAASNNVNIKAKSLTNEKGNITAAARADINVIDDIDYDGVNSINANDLALTTQGNFTNSGKLSAQSSLSVNAANINNLKDASLVSGGTTVLNAGSDINNRGLINGSNTYLDAGNSVNNDSFGRIYGDHVAIEAKTLNNTPDKFTKIKVDECESGPGCLIETTAVFDPKFNLSEQQIENLKTNNPTFYQQNLIETKTYYKVSSDPAPIIAARERLDIGVESLNNNPNQARAGIFNADFNGQAKLLSNGELHIGGSLDDAHHATGKAKTVTNKGATIESVGDMSISTETLNNINADFRTQIQEIKRNNNVKQFSADGKIFTEEQVSQVKGGEDNAIIYLVDDKTNKEYKEYKEYDKFTFNEVLKGEKTIISDPSRIIGGGNIKFDLDTFNTDKSQIIAGGEISVKGKVANVDAEPSTIIPKYDYENVKRTTFRIEHDCTGTSIGNGCINGHWRDKTKQRDYSATQPLEPKTTGTPYRLKILNLQNQGVDIYDSAVTITNHNASQKTTIENSVVQDLNAISDAIKTLTQAKLTVSDKESSTTVNTAALKDATDLLSSITKAEDSSLTEAQKQQIAALLKTQKEGKPVDGAVIDGLIDSLDDSINKVASEEIRSSSNAPTLPNSSLFGVNPDSNANYLIETDPSFTDYKNWLSSDYMMQRLNLDPSVTHKRLGDGYYEQQLIKDQINALTGQYYLGDYRSNDEQYRGLMDAAIIMADKLNLRPGIALTAEQVAKLTTDIVWLVEQTVTLDDGTIQKVLAPKVYTRQAVGQIDGTGTLIAADSIDMQLSGDVVNQGNIVGHKNLNIQALSLSNESGLIEGEFVKIGTVKDLTNNATIKAGSAAQFDVGGNFNNQSTTYSTSAAKGASTSTRTGIDQIASIYIGDGLKGQTDENGNPYVTFNANVGGDTNFAAGRLNNRGGASVIDSKGNVNLGAVNTSYQTDSVGDANNYHKQGASQDIGSQITGADNIIIKSGKSITGTATQINSDTGTVGVQAADDITFKEGRGRNNLSTGSKSKESNWYGSKRITESVDLYEDNALITNINGNSVFIDSKNGNVSLIGSNVKASEEARVTAMNGKVTVQSAVDKESLSSNKSTENFYKETGKQQGHERDTLNKTGISGGEVYVNGQNVAVNAAKLQAREGNLQIGDATLATDKQGNLQLDDNGKPIVKTGSIDNLTFGTVELKDHEWDEEQKGYKGIAKGVMQVAGVVGGALGITDGVTISESKGYDTTKTTEEVSELTGDNILVGGNQVQTKGTKFSTTKPGGSIYVLGHDVDLGVAKSSTSTTQTHQVEKIDGEGIKLSSDNIQLGAVERIDSTDSTTTTVTTNQGTELNTDNLILLGDMKDGSLTTTAAKLNTKNLIIGAKTTVLDGIEDTKDIINANTTDTTRVSVEAHHVSVDLVSAAEQVKKAASAVKDAKEALSDAKDKIARGELSADAINDYKINLAGATANLANAQINLGNTASTAANTSGTLGFSATAKAEHSLTQSESANHTGTWQGTQINADNVTAVGGDFTGVGLQGKIGQLNIDNLNSFNLKAGTNTNSSSSNSTTKSQSGSISTTGTASVGVSQQQSQSQSSSTTYTNSELNVGELNGYAGTTNLTGGRINASGGSYSTDKLKIKTVQDTGSSSNRSSGGNVGVNFGSGGISGGNIGANKSQGSSNSLTPNEQSGIIYYGDDHSLTAKDTINDGGIIAKIDTDKDGNQSSGKVNFITDTLETHDLINTATNDQRNIGGNLSGGKGKNGASINNASIQAGHTGREYQSITKATVGEGAIVTSDIASGQDSLAGVNRDALNTETVIKDMQTGGLDLNATVDTRVFTDAGRKEIAKEQRELVGNIKETGKDIAGAAALGYETGKNINNTIQIAKKIEEVRDTLTLDEQVIFDNELRKLQVENSLESNVVPVVAGAAAGGVAIGATEAAVGLTGLGIVGCAATEICSETVHAGLNNAQANAIAAAEEVRKATNAILAKSKGKDIGNGQNAFGSSSQVASTPPDPDEDGDGGIKLTGRGKRSLGNLTNLKDKTVADAIRSRGGTGSNVNKVESYLRNEKVGEIANRAARGDPDAVTALKLIKDAKRLSQKR